MKLHVLGFTHISNYYGLDYTCRGADCLIPAYCEVYHTFLLRILCWQLLEAEYWTR